MQNAATARFNVVGTYQNMAGARRAVDALQFAGLDPGHISLEGAVAERTSRRADASKQTIERDAPMASRIAGRVILCAIAGAITGSMIGLVFYALGLSVVPQAGDNAAVVIGSWTLMGLIVGGMSSVSQGDAWELTFQPTRQPGQVRVAVRSDNHDDINLAEKVFQEKEATNVSASDANGAPLP